MPKKSTDVSKPSRKEIALNRSKLSAVDGSDGVFTKCARSNETGDVQLNFELEGHLVRATINPNTEQVKGRIIHI